jgi:hypothetical protein
VRGHEFENGRSDCQWCACLPSWVSFAVSISVEAAALHNRYISQAKISGSYFAYGRVELLDHALMS